MKTYKYRASNLKSTITFLASVSAKNCQFQRYIHTNNNIIIIIFFIRVFSECIVAFATSLIPLVTNFPEICTFIIGFIFTVWTTMRPLLAH